MTVGKKKTNSLCFAACPRTFFSDSIVPLTFQLMDCMTFQPVNSRLSQLRKSALIMLISVNSHTEVMAALKSLSLNGSFHTHYVCVWLDNLLPSTLQFIIFFPPPCTDVVLEHALLK